MNLKIFTLLVIIGVATAAPTFESRIVNGTDARVEDYPYIISLRGSFGSHSCGGSLISNQWVLTAAHCVNPGSPGSYSVQYGTTDISPGGDTVASVRQIIRHSGYNPGNHYIHDIALIELSEPIEFGRKVQPVQLPQPFYEVPITSSDATLIGWGLNATGGIIPRRLQQVHYFIVNDFDCNRIHSGGTHPTNICAAYPGGGKGQCSGDSGGPLTSNGYQVGIVSWSVKPCAVAPYPGVFTKVSHYIHWIEAQTGLILS